MTLMNGIRDISKFVVVFPVPDKTFSILTILFMKYVLNIFCLLVVLDDGTAFNETFIVIRQTLILHKSITIASENLSGDDTFGLLVSPLVMLGIVHRLMVPKFFIASQLLEGIPLPYRH